jgi:hypothetical protein
LFSFFAGALADVYGCKRFILLPMIGMLISDIGMLINYIFINELPIEFFYIEPIYSFFGGKAVYYLGKIFLKNNLLPFFVRCIKLKLRQIKCKVQTEIK